MTGGSRLLVRRALRAMLGGVDSGMQKIIKSAKAIFCIAALTLVVAQPVSAQGHLPSDAWEFQPQRCRPIPQDTNEQLLCSDPELRQADIALSRAYQEKIAQLVPAQVDALRINHSHWFVETCSDGFSLRPPPLEDARACLKQELSRRLQFVLALPTDRPTTPYLFSPFERALLRTYAGKSMGLISGMTVVDADALSISLRRVFAAMVPRKSDVPVQDADGSSESLSLFTVDDFLHAAFIDSADLEYGRYFVDSGFTPHDGPDGGMFVVDLETGETALAFTYTYPPGLLVWEKACASPAFREESEALFRKYTTAGVASSQSVDTPKRFDALIGEVAGEIHSTPCK